MVKCSMEFKTHISQIYDIGRKSKEKELDGATVDVSLLGTC